MNRQVDIKALVSHIVRGDGINRCRICMGETKDGQVFLGDTVMMDGDNSVSLAELLHILTGIEVDYAPPLPGGLCRTCTQRAVDAASFRSFCLQSATRWDTTVGLLENIPERTETQPGLAVLVEDSLVMLQDNRHTSACQCPDCGKPFSHPFKLHLHLSESTQDRRACQYCARVMTRQQLLEHLAAAHQRIPRPCSDCNSVFVSEDQLRRHRRKDHGRGEITCGDCGRTYRTNPAYNAHISVHAPRTCTGCDTLFRNQVCFKYHVKHCQARRDRELAKTVDKKLEHSNSRCYCDLCGKSFVGKKYVRAHLQNVHSTETHRPCPTCGKVLPAAYMKAHMTEHVKREYRCEHCGLVLRSALGMSQHVRLHTGEKPYKCPHCPLNFLASSRRSAHVKKVHRGESELRHACAQCPAKFRLPHQLRTHYVTAHHTTDKPAFECNNCGEKFGSCRGLVHHARKHQNIAHKSNKASVVKKVA